MKRFVVAALLLLVLVSCGPKAERRPVGWVLVPAADAEAEKGKYEDARQYLEEALDRTVTLRVPMDYAAVTLAMKRSDPEKEILISRLGPFEFVISNTQVEIEALVRGVKASTQTDAYHSYIIVHKDSDIRALDDFRGRTFAFVDVGSTSGYLIPKGMFELIGMAEEDFKDVTFVGGHDAVILAVKAGHVDGGAVADNRYRDAIDDGVIGEGELVVVQKSEAIANSPIAVRADLDEGMKEQIRAAFLSMPPEILAPAKVLGYVRAENEDYRFLVDLATALGLMPD